MIGFILISNLNNKLLSWEFLNSTWWSKNELICSECNYWKLITCPACFWAPAGWELLPAGTGGVLQWFFIFRQSQSEMGSDFSLHCSILRGGNALILCLYIYISIYTFRSSGPIKFQFSSCWVAPIFQLNGWMQDKTLAGNEKSISPPPDLH